MESSTILDKVGRYYTSRLEQHGATPSGVDWNSKESQELRFDLLLQLVDAPGRFSLNDYGCGFGSLADYMRTKGLSCDYHGFDISERMIETARQLHAGPGTTFTTNNAELTPADYAVASGIFNVRLDTSHADWTDYVLQTLDRLHALSTRGFGFNVLTSYSDADRMRSDLYYADPCFLFDHCKKHYSRRVALLHDYKLWEFTMLVRKGT